MPKLARVAFCTEGYYQGFNKRAAAGKPNLETFKSVVGTLRGLDYTGVEVVSTTLSSEPLKMSLAERDAFREAARAEDMKIVGLHWLLAGMPGVYLTNPDPAVKKITVETVSGLIQLAADLGSVVVVQGSPNQRKLLKHVTYPQAFDTAVENYQRVINQVGHLEVAVCVEQLSASEPNDFLTTLPEMKRFVEAVNRGWVVGHLDVKALWPACKTPQEAAEMVNEYARMAGHFHLNEWLNLSGPGCSELDMRPIFEAIGQSGYYEHPIFGIARPYPRWLSVEIFDFMKRDVTPDGLTEIARKSMECIQANAELIEPKISK